jgi:hypothetical protein
MRSRGVCLSGLARLFFLALAVGCAATGPGRREPARFAPAALREDFAVLRQALEQAHPGLLRYATADEMARAFRSAEEAIQAPMTEVEFLGQVAAVLAHIRDDHTYALPSSGFWRTQIGATAYGQKSTAGELPLFPFFVTVEASRVFITHNNSANPATGRGTEILRINARPIAEVLAALERVLPTSGFSATFRRRRLEQFSPQQEYNVFCVYYALFLEAPETFAIDVRAPRSSRVEKVTVPAVRAGELWANFRARYVGTDDPLLARERPLRLERSREDTALVALTTFHDWRWRRDRLDFRKEIGQAFSTLREQRTANLVLDLRGNEGGNAAMAVEVMGYLALAPFQVYDYKELRGYRFPALMPHVQSPKALDHLKADMLEQTADGRFRIKTTLPDETWSRPLQPSSPAFSGRLFVLVDGATGSAAAQLATLVRVNRRDAVFVGEESGVDMTGPISGSYLDLKLPHTGVRVDVPILRKVLKVDGYPHEPGRGIRPDFPVNRAQEDIADGRDPALR